MTFSSNDRKWLMRAGGTLATILVLFGIYRLSGCYDSKTRRTIGVVTRQDFIQRVTFAGVVVPFKKTIVTAPYNGYVSKLFVSVGDSVKAGDPIVSVVQSLQSGDSPFPLRSPLNGVVVQLERSEGEYVREGDYKEFILRIDDTSRLFVVANAPEMDRVKLRFGQEAVIRASAIIDRKYKGLIRELSLAARDKEAEANSQVVDFPIKIEITDGDEMIKPGMSVVIDVITARKENVLSLRHEFIRRDKDHYFVVLQSGDRKTIEVGIQNEEGFEILSGLSEGQKIRQVNFSELNSAE